MHLSLITSINVSQVYSYYLKNIIYNYSSLVTLNNKKVVIFQDNCTYMDVIVKTEMLNTKIISSIRNLPYEETLTFEN